MIRGELLEERLPWGGTRIVSREFPPLPEQELRVVADRIRDRLGR